MSSCDTNARRGGPNSVPLLTSEQAGTSPRWARPIVTADYIGTTTDVLAKWRHLNRGPSYVVPPGVRSVMYDLNEVDTWLAAGRIETSDSARVTQAKTTERAA